MRLILDRERAKWPNNAPDRIYYEHVRNFVGDACFPGEWIVDGAKSLPPDLVFDFPYDLADATPAQIGEAHALLRAVSTRKGGPSAALTEEDWRQAYNLELARQEISRNENEVIVHASMMHNVVSYILRGWCADGRVRAFLQNDNGSFSELPAYLWNTDRYKLWFDAGGHISAEHAFDALGRDKDKAFPIFFSDVDVANAVKTLPGASRVLPEIRHSVAVAEQASAAPEKIGAVEPASVETTKLTPIYKAFRIAIKAEFPDGIPDDGTPTKVIHGRILERAKRPKGERALREFFKEVREGRIQLLP